MKTSLFCAFLLIASHVPAQNADSLKQLLTSAKTDSTRHQINTEIGYVLMYDYPDSARNYFKAALMAAKAMNSNQRIASSMTLTGVTYYFNGQFEQAMDYYLQALALSEKTENDRYTGIISNNIGAVYFEMQEYQKASGYYASAIKLFEAAKDTFWLSNSLNNMGNALEKTNQYDQALDVYQQSLGLARHSNNNEAIGSAMSNLGNVYMAIGKYDEALHQYSTGVKYQRLVGDRTGEAISYNNIGQLLAGRNEHSQALEYHQQAMEIAEDIGHLETKKNATKWLSEVYFKLGNNSKAYSLLSEFIVLNDSLVGIEKTNAVEELNKKYETEKKERAIAELELDKKNASLALANSNNQRNIFIFGFMIILVVAGFIYYRYTTKKKNSELLENKNAQITSALEEREMLLKEIHHRVKNNLQVISSLLKLQAGSLEDEAAVDAIKEGQHRVKSMALIHQKLYSAEDIRGVDVQDYFENLIIELKSAFGRTDIMSEVETNGLKLDIDTVIPLGLMVNELITNSLKYAFEDEEEGKLSVEINEDAEQLHVVVRDNGPGVDLETYQTSNSFGWKMIRSLSRKVKAEIEVTNNSGTTVTLSLSRYKLVS